MNVIGHAVDLKHLLTLIGNNAGNVFVNLFFVVRLNQTLPALNSEDYLDVNLSIGVCHRHCALR